jgi:hypothetical protein
MLSNERYGGYKKRNHREADAELILSTSMTSLLHNSFQLASITGKREEHVEIGRKTADAVLQWRFAGDCWKFFRIYFSSMQLSGLTDKQTTFPCISQRGSQPKNCVISYHILFTHSSFPPKEAISWNCDVCWTLMPVSLSSYLALARFPSYHVLDVVRSAMSNPSPTQCLMN